MDEKFKSKLAQVFGYNTVQIKNLKKILLQNCSCFIKPLCISEFQTLDSQKYCPHSTVAAWKIHENIAYDFLNHNDKQYRNAQSLNFGIDELPISINI